MTTAQAKSALKSAKAFQSEVNQILSKKEPTSDLLTIHEVAQRLRVDETTVRRWIIQGALEAIALPHRGKKQVYRIRRTTLERLLEAGRVEVQR